MKEIKGPRKGGKKVSNLRRKWAVELVARMLRENKDIRLEGTILDEGTRLDLAEILDMVAANMPLNRGGQSKAKHIRWAIEVEAGWRCYAERSGKARPKGLAIEEVARRVGKSHRTVETEIGRYSGFVESLFKRYEDNEPDKSKRLEYYRYLFEGKLETHPLEGERRTIHEALWWVTPTNT